MSNLSLQDSFKEFCEINKLEVNAQQVEIISSLEKFLDNNSTITKEVIEGIIDEYKTRIETLEKLKE